MEQNKPEIEELISAVNKVFGKVPGSPTEFDQLADQIYKKTGIKISTSTLKRLWGYVKGYRKTRLFTFDILCRYAEKGSWKGFRETLSNINVQSDFFTEDILYTKDTPANATIEVTWRPNRHCIFRHIEGEMFIVEKSENSKLNIGDTFTCHAFRDAQPLYLDELQHGELHTSYVVGESDGILFRVSPEE